MAFPHDFAPDLKTEISYKNNIMNGEPMSQLFDLLLVSQLLLHHFKIGMARNTASFPNIQYAILSPKFLPT
jgi:hypothetical protein